MRLVLVLAAAVAAAVFTYGYLERLGRRAWPAMLCRALAWAAIGLLVLDLSCALRPGARRPRPPLVLLDASLSLGAAGGRWREALDSARAWGEVRAFGGAGGAGDSVPAGGRSRLGPALDVAAASDRPVLIVTDGEIEDAPDLRPELLRRVGIRLFPREAVEDLALAAVSGPARVTAGDTAHFEVEVRSFGARRDTVWVEVQAGGRVLARRAARIAAGRAVRLAIPTPTAGLQGAELLRIELIGAADREPRDDARLWVLEVSRTPGVVLLASPPDWDARFLFRAVRDVARLPVKGYASLTPGEWRGMETLAPVNPEEVRQAARRADVLVVKGRTPGLERNPGARAVWRWPSGEGGEAVLPGDWYASLPGPSPLSNAFVGLPVDSFPPLLRVTPIEASPEAWVALSAQLGRRGAERPVLVGRATPSGREVLTAADGFWRWAFRGGSSEQAYRGLVAAAMSWLLEQPDTTRGRARPLRAVAEQGRPLIFAWTGSGAPVPLGIALEAGGGVQRDTLRFDGAGRAELRLPPGAYRYRLDGGGEGLVAVEEYSSEFLPRPVALAEQPLPEVRPAAITSTRAWIWLFGLAIAGLAGEWLVRRRLGLR
ncbi:MAG TPA: hypothetical protein VNJ71_11480 [Gemmatimonadales bacterium]|jgi:hypothetical protein|nr:hypothetical protein [Gemmatimonadales bacterium]